MRESSTRCKPTARRVSLVPSPQYFVIINHLDHARALGGCVLNKTPHSLLCNTTTEPCGRSDHSCNGVHGWREFRLLQSQQSSNLYEITLLGAHAGSAPIPPPRYEAYLLILQHEFHGIAGTLRALHGAYR